jgi:hypothetical protein
MLLGRGIAASDLSPCRDRYGLYVRKKTPGFSVSCGLFLLTVATGLCVLVSIAHAAESHRASIMDTHPHLDVMPRKRKSES